MVVHKSICLVAPCCEADADLGLRLFRSLQELYPDSKKICTFDGKMGKYEAQFKKLGVKCIKGLTKATSEASVIMMEGQLEEFMKTGCEYFIRTEPDTLWRECVDFPDAKVFGQVHNTAVGPYIQGGLLGLHKEVVSKILTSKILRVPQYLTKYTHEYKGRTIVADDVTFSRLALVFGYQFTDMSKDVQCYGPDSFLYTNPDKIDITCAKVIHPAKEL